MNVQKGFEPPFELLPLPNRRRKVNCIDDINNDQSDTVADFILSEMEVENTKVPLEEREEKENKKYDREAMLRRLADLATSEDGRGLIILDVARLKLGQIPTEFAQTPDIAGNTVEERKMKLVEDLRETLKPVPESMIHYMTGWFNPGDCGRPSDQKPDWLDMEKLRRGQKFAQDYSFSILYSELIALFALYNFDDGLKPLIITGRSDTPHGAFKRYISTAKRFKHWYTQDMWSKETAAWNDLVVVRAMHKSVTRRLHSSTNAEIDAATEIDNAKCPSREILRKDFFENCEAPVIGQCPYVVVKNNPNRPKGITQTEMAITQWSIIGLIITDPKSLGIHNATDEDLEAFCHLWRSLGYQLGIEDEYNFCRGTLDEIRQRNRDLIETWIKPNFREITPEWEHMGRCLITALTELAPLVTYEITLIHLLDILGLQMPQFYASLSYMDRIACNLFRSVLYYGARIPGVNSLINMIGMMQLNRAAKITPERHEALRIKLNSGFNGNNNRIKENSTVLNL